MREKWEMSEADIHTIDNYFYEIMLFLETSPFEYSRRDK